MELSGSDGTTSVDFECPHSDLPDPFCHELRQYWEPIGYPVGVVEQVRDGFRPLLVSGRDDFGLRLVTPLPPADILAEVDSPFTLDWNLAGDLPIHHADFDGDGLEEIVLTVDQGSGKLQVAVLDSTTLDTVAFRDFGATHEVSALRTGSLDLDGDGIAELISGERVDQLLTINVWSIVNGQFSLIASEPTDLQCPAWDFMAGDYNGDGHGDLAVAWHGYCEAYPNHDPPEIISVLGGSAIDGDISLVRSPQPPSMRRAVSGDFDGDAATEILIVHDVQTLSIVKWQSGGFGEPEMLTVEQSPGVGGLTFAGRFSAAPFDGITHGQYATHHPDGSFDLYHGALFPQLGAESLVPLPHAPVVVGDVNADDIDDLIVIIEDRFAIYISRTPWL